MTVYRISLQESIGNVEAVFPPEKIRKISGGNTVSNSVYFRCFPERSGGRNLRPRP